MFTMTLNDKKWQIYILHICVCSVLLAQLTHIASWYTADASTFILIAITLITWFLFFFGFRDASERDGFICPSLRSKKWQAATRSHCNSHSKHPNLVTFFLNRTRWLAAGPQILDLNFTAVKQEPRPRHRCERSGCCQPHSPQRHS